MRGGALMGETCMHGMHACTLNNCACVRSCVVNMRAMMHTCICDRGT
jgi:carbonic anhydrase/acetyltransferase-like protein (isoleucine patch superfamily)